MPGYVNLRRTDNGQLEQVSTDEALAGIDAGRYVDPGTLPAERRGALAHERTSKLREDEVANVTSGADIALKEGNEAIEREHDTLGSRARAFVGGGVSMLDAGLWKPWSEDQDAHSNYALAGGIAATIPSLFTGGGEATAAVKGAELGAEALSAGKALRSAYSWSAPGIATRAMGAAEELVPAAGALGRVAKTAAGATAYAETDELLRQALDPDREFSGEQLLHAGKWGLILGGGGAALSEGIGAARGAASRFAGAESKGATKAVDELEMLGRHVPERPVSLTTPEARGPWSERIDLARDPGRASVRDGIVSLRDDLARLSKVGNEALASAGARQVAGLSAFELTPLVRDANVATKQLSRLLVDPEAPIERLAANLHSADTLGQRLRSYTDRLPARWGDDAVRAGFWKDLEGRLSRLPADADPALVAGERLSAHLSVGRAPAEADAVRSSVLGVLGRQLMGSKLGTLSTYGAIGGGAVLLGEHLIDGAAGSLVRGAAGLMALKSGGGLALRAIQAAFRDPAVGGLLAGTTTSVLDRAHVLPDDPDRRSTDPRRALRDFAERTRRITPAQASASTAGSLSHMAGATPESVASAAETAGRRQAYVLRMLDTADPVATSPLGRPLPSSDAARRVADTVRVLASPNNVVIAALAGRLTPEALSAAQAVYPATVARLRAAVLSQLSHVRDPSGLPPATRRLLSQLLGPQAGGDQAERVAYRSAMDAAAARSAAGSPAAQQQNPPRPPGPVAENPLSSPSQRAVRPAGGR